MPQPANSQPGLLIALWFSFVAFLGSLFKKPPSATALPKPVTAKSSKGPATVRERISQPSLQRPTSAASSPISSAARTTPVRRSPSAPKRTTTDPEHIPPPSPFLSLSGIFATPPLLTSSCLASDIELDRLSPPSPPKLQSLALLASPGSPPHGPTTLSLHTPQPSPPRTPRTPSSAVMAQLDRSTLSPTAMSDGSLEVISLGDRLGFVGSPAKAADIGRLTSPWSPTGKVTSADVWVSVDGMLMNATGPVECGPALSEDDSAAPAITLASLAGSGISTSSLYSSPSALDALGISVFVNLGVLDDHLSSEAVDVNRSDDLTSVPKLSKVRDKNRPMLVTPEPQAPPKRRETLPSTMRHTPSISSRATKCLSTPLTKLDNAGISHFRSTSSISSMAYEVRLGLLAEGKSTTAIESIISMLDQASPESVPPHNNSMQLVEII